jgi:dGTPase
MLSDKARIVTSTAFRRLQVKAQVFSLEQNAAVRSRLTHTLEVATYGELIARKAADQLCSAKLLVPSLIFPFVTIVQNACLLHDIGNPPFGHLGEYAIRAWFQHQEHVIRERWANHGLEQSIIEPHLGGLKFFDGNPQGLRIVMRLQRWRDEFGLNLTFPLLASMVKYLDVSPCEGNFRKKAGFFETERPWLSQIWTHLGLQLENGRPRSRYPLTFLMEAADDIAYCVSDIEDAIEKHVVREDLFLKEIPQHLKHYLDTPPSFLGFKTSVTRALVQGAADIYVSRHSDILNGSMATPLLDGDPKLKSAVDWLKEYTKSNVFRSPEAVEVELSGFRIITDLLDFFSPLLFEGTHQFERLLPGATIPPKAGELPLEQRMFSLLSKKHLETYKFHVSIDKMLEPIFRARCSVSTLIDSPQSSGCE